MRIGFLCGTFFRHSCGYLLKWLILGLEGKAELFFYNLSPIKKDDLAQWFERKENFFQCADLSSNEVADLIINTGIDVIIDIDGVTNLKSCAIISIIRQSTRKPLTVSWMGFSPSGLCEYVIGDLNLIPNPEIYIEKVLYLPNCFISCGGFDIGDIEFTREDLGIPEDAIALYFCQKEIKITQEIVEILNRILSQTDNTFLAIKSFAGNLERQKWLNILEHSDRVRFIPCSLREEDARANLRLVDIVLDSFPYNGTLTTLEALWMGLPVISRHGQRWASRQGISLLSQAKILTFSDWEGYIDRVVELVKGKDVLHNEKERISHGCKEISLWNYRQHSHDFLDVLSQL